MSTELPEHEADPSAPTEVLVDPGSEDGPAVDPELAALPERLRTGAISWMARNKVTANLMMFMIFIGGLAGVLGIKQEIFPAFDLDTVIVAVPYPGASPEEIEQGIVLAVEERVRGVDGVKRVKSTAAEGLGTVTVELLISADPDKVLSDVKNEIDRITTFPDDAEEPQITLATTRSRVVSLVIYGDADLPTLHALAEQARAELLASNDVTQVEIEGVPPLEISIEVPRETLRAYGLTLQQVAAAIDANSKELPGGSVKTGSGEVLVRVSDRKRTAQALSDVIVLSTPAGGTVRLGDIAKIQDGFQETDQASFFDGKRAVRVTAYRIGDETPQKVAAAVHHLDDELNASLPDTIHTAIWDDDSVLLQGRIRLLLENAFYGGILVVIVLALFLNLRLAFWVAVGIPTSFFGAFLIMPAADVSVNMISLFALIVTLGLVVDDAIVVGENIFDKLQAGMEPMKASIQGAKQMAMPVTFAVLTSVAAFAPMFFVPGVFGKIFRIMPIVVIAVLLFSLLEGFFILPAHLAHGSKGPPGIVGRFAGRIQARVADWLARFTRDIYQPQLEWALANRYTVLAASFALLAATVGIVGGGVVPFSFFPRIEGDVVSVSARLPYGVPVAETERVQATLEAAADRVIAEHGLQDAVEGRLATVGEITAGGGPGGSSTETGSHLLALQVQFVPAEDRDFTSAWFQEQWAAEVPPMAGIEAMSFTSDIGPAASEAAVAVQLSHRDSDVLAAASASLAEELRGYPDLVEVENGFASGKAQLDFALRPEARSLGLTSLDVAGQIRSAFYGAEALREQRDRNELKVMVRLPKDQRVSEHDIEELEVRTASGGYVPLAYVAEFERVRAPTSIELEGGRRIVDVTANLAPGVASNQPILRKLQETTIDQLKRDYPGLDAELVGQQREQNESLSSLGRGYLIALFGIFALLAIPFKSYFQPAVVMSAIPFGIVGAVLGHLVMGYELSLISLFGIIALSGVVVNDSLVLIDATNERRAEGATAAEAVIYGGTRRLRPILLTSFTTFFGLFPMILETEVQARFLIPMAISLGFGVLFSTFITLLLVPALYMILDDGLRFFGAGRFKHAPADEGDAAAAK
ncbi:MAG: efflux RND transporter permease subunit [Alphaproteobacteria bacterium]|nr:efflux RND transporter permease subunit [Alphaproteobacteria bacterium]